MDHEDKRENTVKVGDHLPPGGGGCKVTARVSFEDPPPGAAERTSAGPAG